MRAGKPWRKRYWCCLDGCFFSSIRVNLLYLLMSAVLAGRVESGEIFVPRIPENELEARGMLQRQLLDSTLWSAIKEYYAQPLSVPSGELSRLPDIFPDIDWPELPVADTILSRYEPWTPYDIRRFLQDYPFLSRYAPILSFGHGRSAAHGSTEISFYRNGAGEPSVFNRSSVKADRTIAIDARTEIAATFLWWKTRTVSLQSPAVGTLRFGNYRNPEANNLFLGYFPQDVNESSNKDNWLYAEGRTWNGVYCRTASIRGWHGAGFFHSRPSETIIGASAEVKPAGNIELNLTPAWIQSGTIGGGDRDTHMVLLEFRIGF
jgi:hypothetical protein